jgi:pimeloyl-ACP methyl ester carboxylesterase
VAICAAINPPIAKVAMTASIATFAVRALVDCNGRRGLERLQCAARTVWGDSTERRGTPSRCSRLGVILLVRSRRGSPGQASKAARTGAESGAEGDVQRARRSAAVGWPNPERGPLLIISGDQDHTVPWVFANAAFKKQRRNAAVTEIIKVPNRGHSLTIDGGWREVADAALAFVRRST